MANSYPVEILPKREYELKLDIHSLMKVYPNLCVSRRIDGEREKLVIPFDGDYVLSVEALKKVGVANFSVNLLGACFDTDAHIQFRPIGDTFTQSWNGNDLSFEITEDLYERKEPCFAVFYNVKGFLEFPVKQEVTFVKENDYIAFRAKAIANGAEEKYVEAFKKGEKTSLPVHQRANHMPTCSNYWHVTFDMYSFDNPQVPIDNNDSHAPIKRILRLLRHDFLTMQGIINISEYDTIAPYFYLKGKCNVLKRKYTTCVKMLQRLSKRGLK